MTFCLLLLGCFGTISASEAPEVVEATYPVKAAARSRLIFELPRGPHVLERLELTVEDDALADWAGVLLRISWDGASAPAVDLRIDDLFGTVDGAASPGFAPARRAPSGAVFDLPMPYAREAQLSLTAPRAISGSLRLRLVTDDRRSLEENGYMQIRSASIEALGRDDRWLCIGGAGKLLGLSIRGPKGGFVPDDEWDWALDRPDGPRQSAKIASDSNFYSRWWLEAPPRFSRSLDLGGRLTRQGPTRVTLFYRSGGPDPVPGPIEGP